MKSPFLVGVSLLVPAILELCVSSLIATPSYAAPVASAKKSGAAPASLPSVIKVADPNDAMSGRVPRNPTFQPISPKKGMVRGWVKTADGKPLAGAHIIAQSSYAGGFRTSAEARSNAAGLYEIILPVGIAEVVNADVKVRFNGKRYLLPLHPADGELDTFSSGPGHVENFVLRTYGPANDDYDRNPEWSSNYYGGSIRVQWFSSAIEDGDGKVQITLTPDGPLLDGSKGATLIFSLPQTSGEHYLNDIPIGKYQLSAKVIQNGTSTPIGAKKLWAEGAAPTTLPIVFQYKQGELASLGRSGIEQFEVILGS